MLMMSFFEITFENQNPLIDCQVSGKCFKNILFVLLHYEKQMPIKEWS